MPKINITEPEFVFEDDDPEGYRSGMARVGPSLGGKATGSPVHEIPPGAVPLPYHYECGEEGVAARLRVGVWTGDKSADVIVPRSSQVPNYDGEG